MLTNQDRELLKNISMCLTVIDHSQPGTLMYDVNRLVEIIKREEIEFNNLRAENAMLTEQRDRLLKPLKAFADKYNAAPDGELGIGLVNGDFFRAIEAIAEVESQS